MRQIRPQPGRQEEFLSCSSDICIYGGSAGGGKTFALLLEPLRHIGNSSVTVTIFRQNSVQIFNAGGLWDSSMEIYPFVGGKPVKSPRPHWVFPSGMKIIFSHIESDSDLIKWQGSQIALIEFDELTHFSRLATLNSKREYRKRRSKKNL